MPFWVFVSLEQRRRYKHPVSALVVVYTRELDVLLLERADYPGIGSR